MVDAIVSRIGEWTCGHPFLSEILYRYATQYSAQIVAAEGTGIVDEIVRQKILKNWQTNEAADCFLNI